MGVGPRPADGAAVVGLFRKRGWEVVPSQGCAVNHPILDVAFAELQAALDSLRGVVAPFDHAAAEPWRYQEGALRNAEFTVERDSGRVQLVLVWNGVGDRQDPGLEALLERLWPAAAGEPTWRWHSIFVHWREPAASLKRAVLSKRREAWKQVRPVDGSASEVTESLDGLQFRFGPASFQQANLGVYERMLRDMKAILLELLEAEGFGRERRGGRPARMLELCGGVGAIGLSLAHHAAQHLGGGAVELLSTDVNDWNVGVFEENARSVFPGLAVQSGELRRRGRATATEPNDTPTVCFEALSAMDAVRRYLRGGRDGKAAESAPDVLILDPPRRGLAKDERYLGLPGPGSGENEVAIMRGCDQLRAIIYMSCGPRSFMVDADRLMAPAGREAYARGRPFRLASLACYDMFPFTAHIETLGVFVR